MYEFENAGLYIKKKKKTDAIIGISDQNSISIFFFFSSLPPIYFLKFIWYAKILRIK